MSRSNKSRRPRGTPKSSFMVPHSEAVRRILRVMTDAQKEYMRTGDPSDRVSLPVLEVSRRAGTTRSRTANIIEALPPIWCSGCGQALPAKSFIVQATVKSPRVVKTAFAILGSSSCRVTADKLRGTLKKRGYAVSPRIAREIVWEFRHNDVARRSKRRGNMAG